MYSVEYGDDVDRLNSIYGFLNAAIDRYGRLRVNRPVDIILSGPTVH